MLIWTLLISGSSRHRHTQAISTVSWVSVCPKLPPQLLGIFISFLSHRQEVGCWEASVLSLIVLLTIVFRQKNTSKVIPLGLHFNLRLVLIWPAFSVNILSLNKVTRARGNVLFLDVSMGCGEQRECENMSPVTFAGVLAKHLRLPHDALTHSDLL